MARLVEDNIRPSSDDLLVFLGDYIDRGSQSKAVIDYLRQLEHQGQAVVTLLGNHEDVLLRCYEAAHDPQAKIGMMRLEDSWHRYGGDATLRSFNVRKAAEIPADYIEWLRQRPLYYATDDYVMVHAGMNFLINDPFSDQTAMLWAKNYPVVPHKIGNRTLIYGHQPYRLSQIQTQINQNSPSIGLDNGCVYPHEYDKGNLLAFELGSRRLCIQPSIEQASGYKRTVYFPKAF
ncbi:MAG: serine/threonine protein phosphatase [Saprospiraceae bacterium]|nr:serine/threonine protein phosphatase [Saprospiraceae bacterium]